MILFDAYAVLALLTGEVAGPEVAELLRTAKGAAISAAGYAEVLDQLIRNIGTTIDDAVADLAELPLVVVQMDESISARAGILRAAHYHRTTCAISLADAILAATASVAGATVVTSDPHLLDVCELEAIGHHALPQSSGERWRPRRI